MYYKQGSAFTPLLPEALLLDTQGQTKPPQPPTAHSQFVTDMNTALKIPFNQNNKTNFFVENLIADKLWLRSDSTRGIISIHKYS